jgi:hypothetical protein
MTINMSNFGSNSDESKIIDALGRLSDEQLIAVLQEIFSSRRPNPEEDDFNQNRYFFGTSSRILESQEGEPVEWGPYTIEAVAYIDRTHYPEGTGPDHGFCQFGDCSECGIKVRSNVKHGICPICSARVSMT